MTVTRAALRETVNSNVWCAVPECDRPRGHDGPHGRLVSAPRPDQPFYLYEPLP